MKVNLTEAMQIFVAVVEHGSFIGAAEALQLHRPAVSRTIRALEQELGVQLLHRTTRRVGITPVGEQFYQRSLPILEDLADILDQFSAGRSPRGKLRIDVQTLLGQAIVMPRLPEFMALYPQLEIFVRSSDRLNDLVSTGIDCAIRLGELEDSGMVARRIGEVPLVTCAAPDYLHKWGVPDSLDALKEHRAINFMVGHRRQIMPWRFRVGDQWLSIKVPSGLVVDDAATLLSGVLAGIGIVQAPRPALQPYLDSGRLVEVLPELPVESKAVSILYPERRNLSTNVSVFVQWVSGLFG